MGALPLPAAATLTVADLFAKRSQSQPDALALTDGVTHLSYAQLQARVCRLAAALRAVGIGGGDRIAMLWENRIEYIELEMAAAQLGAIVACLNWRLAHYKQPREFRFIELAALPRSSTGKIQRHEIERRML